MSATTDYMNPYNDGYNIFNQFDRILFVPKHPLLQSELNEMQSGQQDQQRWIADYSMNNGTILAGMGFKNEGYSAGDKLPDDTNQNLFSTKNLTVNTNYDDLIVTTGDNYTDHGEIDVTSDATQDDQPLAMNIAYNIPKGTQYITLSFDIAETGTTDDGALENIGMSLKNATTITEATVDGRVLKNGELTDDANYNLTDTRNDLINLSDGNYHKVVVTMDVSKDGSSSNNFDLILNAGFPSVSEGCNVKFDHFKIEQGTEPTTWELSDDDENNVAGSDKRNTKALVSSGFVYLDGYVRRFNAQTINIKGQGFEKIGLHLERQVVNGASDNKIDDDTQGTSTYGQPGANREQYNLTLSYGNDSLDNPHDTVIFYLYNGRVIARANWNRSEKFNNILAQRSYETNGSFLATPYGMQMYAKPNPYDDELINLQFTPGVAYVLGHRIQKDGSDILPVPTERGTMQKNEYVPLRVLPNTTAKDASDPNTPYFQDIPFENPYIKPEYTSDTHTGGVLVIDKGSAPQTFKITVTPQQISPIGIVITRGQSEEFDSNNDQITFDSDSYVYDPQFPQYHIYNDHITNVDNPNETIDYDRDNETANFYTSNDGVNINNNEIQFNLNSISPSGHGTINFGSGDTLYVRASVQMTYRPYNSNYMIQNEENGTGSSSQGQTTHPDFYLIKTNGTYYISFNQCDQDLDITGAANDSNATLSGLTPFYYKPNSEINEDYEMNITYDVYLAREDLITLDRNGHFFDVKGEPALSSDVTPPVNKSRGDNLTLNIGYVKVMPNSQIIQTKMATTPKVPFTNINDMRLELAKLRYDMSVIAANQSTMNFVDPVTLVDIFSDFFTTTDKADISDINFDVLYNPAPYITPSYEAEGYLPLITQGMNDNQNTLTMPLRMNGQSRIENTHYLNQDHQSSSSLPLNNFGLKDQIGTIVCDPEYINDKLTTEQINDPTDVEVLDSAEGRAYLNSQAANGSHFSTLYADGGKASLDSLGTNAANPISDGEELQNKTSVTTGYSRAYFAPQFIHIQGSGFIPNSTDYSVYLPREGNLHLPVETTPPSNMNANDAVTPPDGNSLDYDQKLPGADNPRGYGVNNSSDKPGTVNADGYGNISCWFEIPKGRVRAMKQEVVLQNDGGEKGTDEIDGITYQPYQYNTTNDVVIDNKDIINKNSEIASAGQASLKAAMIQQDSYLTSDINTLSVSASNAANSLATTEQQDDSMLINGIGSMNVSMNDITNQVQADSANLSNLADGVTIYDSFIDNNLNDLYGSTATNQASINSLNAQTSGLQNQADDLYSSATSFYIDHMEVEQDLGNLRNGVDSVADNEMITATALSNAVSVGNANTARLESYTANVNTSLADIQGQTQVNASNFNKYSTNANLVDQSTWAASANTYRELVHREFTPDAAIPGAANSGYEAWCSRWNLSPLLVSTVVHDSLIKPYATLSKTWDASNDFKLAQTKGGLWVKNTQIVYPGEPNTVASWKAISNTLYSLGLLNMHSQYAVINYNPKNTVDINDTQASVLRKRIAKNKRK